MKKLRFKTKQEFINEYGEDWRSRIYWNHNGEMDYLCGTEVPKEISDLLIKEKKARLPVAGWVVKLSDTVVSEENAFFDNVDDVNLADIFKEDPLSSFAPIKETL